VTKKYFGTDGIRGRVGEHPVTAEFMLKLGWAAGRVLGSSGGDLVVIGKDTRISGYMFESSLEAGLIAAGIDTRMLGPMNWERRSGLKMRPGVISSFVKAPYRSALH
jgi:phosphoglucosamine mutase